MTLSPDMSSFASRLHVKGTLVFDSAHRIGAERSLAVDAPDLPVLQTIDGRPYIPGSSFKGAWRSYTESILRTIQSQPGIADRNLACLSIGKPATRPDPDPDEGRCLTMDEARAYKDEYGRQSARLDEILRQESCWTCRIFGNNWLSSKVMIKDLMIDEASFIRTEVRDGVGIDRDSARAADKFKYRFEAVPAGAQFQLEILVENASPAELGLVMLGLKSFERGDILLGGAKSRGLGWCHLQEDWVSGSTYVAAANLLGYLLRTAESDEPGAWGLSDDEVTGWLTAFNAAIHVAPVEEG